MNTHDIAGANGSSYFDSNTNMANEQAWASGARQGDASSSQRPAALTDQLAAQLKMAVATTDRIGSLIADKHFHLFGCPPPSAPSPLQTSKSEQPEGVEAQFRAVFGALNSRLIDIETATSSLVNRL